MYRQKGVNIKIIFVCARGSGSVQKYHGSRTLIFGLKNISKSWLCLQFYLLFILPFGVLNNGKQTNIFDNLKTVNLHIYKKVQYIRTRHVLLKVFQYPSSNIVFNTWNNMHMFRIYLYRFFIVNPSWNTVTGLLSFWCILRIFRFWKLGVLYLVLHFSSNRTPPDLNSDGLRLDKPGGSSGWGQPDGSRWGGNIASGRGIANRGGGGEPSL